MSDENTIEVENGTVELAGSPGHVNLIASDGENEVELRLPTADKDNLAWAVRNNQAVNVELSEGVVAWEPGRGLYVEDYGNADFYLICSPDDQEKLGAALTEARPV